LGTGYGGQGGHLGRGVDARDDRLLHPGKEFGQVGRGYQVAHAPAGHGVDLGEGVDRYQPVARVGHRPDTDKGIVESELVIDLVGDEP
jgi:hypothetical protein